MTHSLSSVRIALMFLLLLWFGHPGWADDAWQATGPEGTSVVTVDIDPADPDRVFALSIGSGAFASHDGGDGWHALALSPVEVPIHQVVPVPGSSDWLLAVVEGRPLRSLDGGASWTVADGPFLSEESLVALLVDPTDPSHVLAFQQTHGFVSHDGGESFELLTVLPEGDRFETSFRRGRTVVLDPLAPMDLYARSERGVLKSVDGGATWSVVLGTTPSFDLALSHGPGEPAATLWYTAPQGLFRSQDGGATWQNLGSPFDLAAFEVAAHPTDPNVAWVGRLGWALTTDGGATFQPLPDAPEGLSQVVVAAADPSRLFGGTGDGPWRSLDGGATWELGVDGFVGFSIRRLAPNPEKPDELLAQSSARLWLTEDHGESWRITLPANDVARAPSRPEIVYARQLNGIRRSEDGGRTWGPLFSYSAPGLLAETEGRLLVAPADAAVIYAAPRNSRDNPQRQIFLVRSDDGGATWTEITPEPLVAKPFMPPPLEPVPVFAPGIPGSLYVPGPSGLWHSTDRGETWALVPPPAAGPIATFAVHPRQPGLLLAAVEDIGLFRTANRGETWTEAEIPVDPTLPAQELLFHPTLPRVGFAVYGTRLLASHDGGNTWDFADEGLPQDAPLRLTPDERSPFILYVQAEERGLFRSLDGGESWHPFDQGLKGLVHFDGPLAVLSGRPVTLYLGTDRGVWTRRETRWLRAVRPRVVPAGN